MATPAKLIGLTVGTTGIAGAGATSLYFWGKNSISIEKQLEKDNKKLLKGDKTEHWTIKFKTYEKETKAKKFEAISDIKDSHTLKKWCKDNLSLNFNDKNKNTYEAAKLICTVPTNKEKLLKENKPETEDTEWGSKLTEFKRKREGELAIPNFDKSKIDDANKIKDWCAEELNKEYENESQSNYKSMIQWCTKEGNKE